MGVDLEKLAREIKVLHSDERLAAS